MTIVISDNLEGRHLDEISWSNDSRIKYVNAQSNLGMWHNFVRSFRQSKTRYFSWVADDDLLNPNFADLQMDNIKKSPNSVAWGGPSVTLHPRYTRRQFCPSRGFLQPHPKTRLQAVNTFRGWNYPFYFTVDTHRIHIDIFERFASWDMPTEALDICWSLGLALSGKLSQIKQPLYFYNPSNWSSHSKSPPSSQKYRGYFLSDLDDQDIDLLLHINRWFLYTLYLLNHASVYLCNPSTKAATISFLLETLWCDPFYFLLKSPTLTMCTPLHQAVLTANNSLDLLHNSALLYDKYLRIPSMSSFLSEQLLPQLDLQTMNILKQQHTKKKSPFSPYLLNLNPLKRLYAIL